ncbi:MAG: S8 family serine peptidase [Desulfobulbaceae bacterium]
MRKKNRKVTSTGMLAMLSSLLLFAGTGFAGTIEDLMAEATRQGEVPVIVELELPTPFIPEGAHASDQGRERQREAIMEAREQFFAMMSGRAAGDYTQYGQWDSLPYVALQVNVNALGFLRNNPLVKSVQEDSLSDPHLASATDHIGADDTWDAGFGGMGQAVVILDTGVDANHPFYGSRVVHEACFSAGAGGQTLCPGGGNSQSGNGSANALTAQCLNGGVNICDHGSHVAGIAAGQDPGGASATGYSGVAPEASIIAIQVFTRFNNDADCGGNPGDAPCVKTWDSDQLSALNYVNTTLHPHWDISSVNMSLGGGMNTAACDGDSRKAAIDNLRSNDIATVISSGNDDWTNALGAPGCISTAVTIGNVFDGNNCGTFDEVTDNMHAVVDLLASGRCVDSSVPDDAYGNKSGTSMAAPEVTGAFAMLKALDPALSVGDIENLLKTTGVLVMDNRAPNPAGADAGHVKPRIQLDAAVASLTEADLRVFKDCKPDQPMLVGDTATCTITVQNLGPDPALGVMAVDEYVSNGTIAFGTVATTAGSCTPTANPQVESGRVDCDLGSILPGTSVTIEIPVTADTPQDINDRVTVQSLTPDPNLANNVAEDEVTVVEIADLEVFKDCKPDAPLLAGETATCFITVKNWGPSTAENVSLADTHVSNGTFNFGTVSTTAGNCTPTANPQVNGGAVNCSFGDLTPGEVARVEVQLLPTERMNINDTAVAASETYDPDNTNNSASDGVGVDPVANLQLTKTASAASVIAGTQLTYDLVVINNGPSIAVNVVIEDVLPAGVTIDSVSSSAGTCKTGVPGNGALPTTCTFDTMPVGIPETMQIVVTVEPQVLGILGNNAKVSSDVYDSDNSDNYATVATTVDANADLAVTKSDSPDPVLAGAKLVYDVTIQNNGPSTAVDVMLSDTLPDEVAFQGYMVSNGSGTCQHLAGPPQKVECDLNNLNPGEFVTVYLTVLVDPSVPDGTSLFDTAQVSAATIDPDGANDSVTIDTLVLAEADLAITKDASYLTDTPAPRITYTLLVSNTGPSDALDVRIVDTLPLTAQKIVYVTDSANGACTYDAGAHQVSCGIGTLPAGESWSVDIVVDARGSVREITNIADVSSATTDPDPLDNTVSKRIRVKGGPGKK